MQGVVTDPEADDPFIDASDEELVAEVVEEEIDEDPPSLLIEWFLQNKQKKRAFLKNKVIGLYTYFDIREEDFAARHLVLSMKPFSVH